MNRRGNTGSTRETAMQKAQLIKEAMDTAVELVNLGKNAEAEKVFLGVIQHHPQNAQALYNLGALAHQREDTEAAEKWFEKSLAITPDDSETLGSLGVVKIELEKKAEGVALLEKAVQSPQASKNVLTWHSMLLLETGKVKEAEELLLSILQTHPDHITSLYGISVIRKFKPDDPIMEMMLNAEKKANNLPCYHQLKLKFALGKALYDCGEYDESFKRYNEANKLKRSEYKYDPKWFDSYFDEMIKVTTPDLVRKIRGNGCESQKPIFIIGMPRSGSTLSEQILASHPHIFGGGELSIFRECIPNIPKIRNLEILDQKEARFHANFVTSITKDIVQEVGEKYLSTIEKMAPNHPRMTDKMLFNFYWVPIIRTALPNAKIVNCTRDPVDIGLSIYRQYFNQAMYWAYDLREIGLFYKNYKRLMDHWNTLFPGEIYEANYETMIADPESAARRLLKACNLPWDDRCLNFHETQREVKTASIAQVRRPIYKDSAKGWKKVEKHLQPLIEALRE